MKTDFDKELEKIMAEDKEIPAHVRKKLDNTYDIIQIQAKRKKSRFIWKRMAAVACTLLIAGATLTNEQVRASINGFFNFEDKGIERAVSEGFAQDNSSTATDQNIQVTLKQNFADAHKIGMSFQLQFEDPTAFETDVTEIKMLYRIKNGDGEYIIDLISDSKGLGGNGHYVASFSQKTPFIDMKNGIAEYEVVLDVNEGNLPILKDAVVEIESIHVFHAYDYWALHEEFGGSFDLPVTTIEGKWDVALANQDENTTMPTIEYIMKGASSNIQVTSATANPTSLNMNFIVDKELFGSEGQPMKIIDENGNEYETDGYNIETKDDKATVKVNFQISSYSNAEKLRFVIENVGEVELLKNK